MGFVAELMLAGFMETSRHRPGDVASQPCPASNWQAINKPN